MNFCTFDIFCILVMALELSINIKIYRIKLEICDHMGLHMWVLHGTLLQIPSQSRMECTYRTHKGPLGGPISFSYTVESSR